MYHPRLRLTFLLLATAAAVSSLAALATAAPHPVGWDRIVRPATPKVRQVGNAFFVPAELRITPTLDGDFTVNEDGVQSGGAPQASPFGIARPFASQTIGVNVRVNNTAGDAANTTNSETSIAANGPNMIAGWNDGLNFGVSPGNTGWAYSTNGGTTWTDGGVLPVPNNLARHEGDPAITNDFAGNFYFADLYTPDGTASAIAVCRGNFSGGGFTWQNPVIVNSSTTDFLDKEWIAADKLSGKVYVSYTRFLAAGGNEIDFQSSNDQGVTWSAPIMITSPTVENVQGSRVVVGPGGFVQLIWLSYNPVNNNNYMRTCRSTNGGATFGPIVTLPTGPSGVLTNYGSGPAGFNRARGIGFPSLAVDFTGGANSGRLYATWEEAVNTYFDPLGTLGSIAETENNGSPATANAVTIGQSVVGTLSSTADQDWFKFNGLAGQTVVIYLAPNGASTEDGFLRVYAGGGAGANRAALSYLAQGVGLVVFTPPTNATYYVRVLANSANLGSYVLYTGNHSPVPGDEVGRDQRDAVLASSADGVTWTTRKVVNDDAPLYDNAFPEVAVDASGQVFVDYYDHRRDVANGITTDMYYNRSGNGGGTFAASLLLNDGPSTNWNNVASNLAPNMGDYSALVADGCNVYANFADGRNGSPDSWLATLNDCIVPAQASIMSADAQPDHVDLTWYTPDNSAAVATVYRSENGTEWTALADIQADGTGELHFHDAAVQAGARYSYRLAVTNRSGPVEYVGQTWVSIPAAARLSMRANTTAQGVSLSFTLAKGDAATIELFDIGGRSVETLRVTQSGSATVGRSLHTGVYLVKLAQGGRSVTQKVAFIR